MEIKQIKNIVEAALLAAQQPQSLPQLDALFSDEDAVSHEDLVRALDALRTDCDERGIELMEVASGYRYQVRQDVHAWVARLWTERPSRYSRALLETLSLIAYRQPITRGEIEQIRGVVVSSHIIKTLEEREWIRVVGHRDAPGKPALFGTTRGFLDYFSLKSLDELPPLAEIRNLEDADPQLDFNAEPAGTAHVDMPEAASADDVPHDAPDSTEAINDSPEAPDDPADDDVVVADATGSETQETDPPTADEAEAPAASNDDAARQDPLENRA